MQIRGGVCQIANSVDAEKVCFSFALLVNPSQSTVKRLSQYDREETSDDFPAYIYTNRYRCSEYHLHLTEAMDTLLLLAFGTIMAITSGLAI